MSGPHIDGAEAMYNALNVVVKDERISAWLVKHDPMALTQCRNALRQYAEDVEARLNAADDDADRINADPALLAAFNELVETEQRFEANGGRGVDDAERIDALRLLLYPDDGDGPFAGPGGDNPTMDLRDVYVGPLDS